MAVAPMFVYFAPQKENQEGNHRRNEMSRAAGRTGVGCVYSVTTTVVATDDFNPYSLTVCDMVSLAHNMCAR